MDERTEEITEFVAHQRRQDAEKVPKETAIS